MPLYDTDFDYGQLVESAKEKAAHLLLSGGDTDISRLKDPVLTRFLVESDEMATNILILSGENISQFKALSLRFWCEEVRREEIPAGSTFTRSARDLIAFQKRYSDCIQGERLTEEQRTSLLRKMNSYHFSFAIAAKNFFDKRDGRGKRLFTWKEAIRLAAGEIYKSGNEHGQMYALCAAAFPGFAEALKEIFIGQNED